MDVDTAMAKRGLGADTSPFLSICEDIATGKGDQACTTQKDCDNWESGRPELYRDRGWVQQSA